MFENTEGAYKHEVYLAMEKALKVCFIVQTWMKQYICDCFTTLWGLICEVIAAKRQFWCKTTACSWLRPSSSKEVLWLLCIWRAFCQDIPVSLYCILISLCIYFFSVLNISRYALSPLQYLQLSSTWCFTSCQTSSGTLFAYSPGVYSKYLIVLFFSQLLALCNPFENNSSAISRCITNDTSEQGRSYIGLRRVASPLLLALYKFNPKKCICSILVL